VVLCTIVTALNPRFVSAANLQNTARLQCRWSQT
jgi:hypothetical protein